MRRRKRRRGHAIDNAEEREFELMRLMQSDLEHARDDLHAACETLCRRKNKRDIFGLHATILCDLFDDFRRRRSARFKNKRRAVRPVPVGQFLKQGLLAGERAAGSRAERKKFLLALAMRKRPARILACKASCYRIGAADAKLERPFRIRAGWGESDLAQSAEADFGDRQTGLNSAAHILTGVNDRLTFCPLGNRNS